MSKMKSLEMEMSEYWTSIFVSTVTAEICDSSVAAERADAALCIEYGSEKFNLWVNRYEGRDV